MSTCGVFSREKVTFSARPHAGVYQLLISSFEGCDVQLRLILHYLKDLMSQGKIPNKCFWISLATIWRHRPLSGPFIYQCFVVSLFCQGIFRFHSCYLGYILLDDDVTMGTGWYSQLTRKWGNVNPGKRATGIKKNACPIMVGR